MSRICLFDRDGKALAELEATCTRSWLLSKVGKASFTLSTRDPKCRREYLEFGNLISIEHEKLPLWGGVIDTPRSWGDGTVTIQAYSGEKLLNYRIGPLNITLKGSAGVIFKRILELAQSEEALPIVAGSFQDDGKERQEVLNLTNLLKECQDLAQKAGGDFILKPNLANGLLQFEFSYSLLSGIETGIALLESHNLKLSNKPLVEQGTICNDLIGYGDGASWTSRPTRRAVDDDSAAQYGRRQGSKNFNKDESGTLQENTEQYIKDHARPVQMLDLQVLDVGETWNWMRLGNIFPVKLHSVGFLGSGFGYSGTATIRGMEFNENDQTVRVIFESEEST